jgi:hypothetical protein
MLIASSSATINQALPIVINSAISLVAIIASAFFGGLFAGLWTNHFESKRRIHDKRHDKYYEHRNTIVQIEQELIPLRVNISRDITAIDDAIANTHETNVRFILRFYKLSLSTGLGLRLLSLDLINKYAELYSAIESFDSDIQYISGMVSSVMEDKKAGKIDDSMVESYKVFLPQLKDVCEQIDQKSLELLGMSKLAIGKEDKIIKDKYIDDGKEINYKFDKKSLDKKYEGIKKEEDGSLHKGEKQPKFVSPFLDLKKVLITPQGIKQI